MSLSSDIEGQLESVEFLARSSSRFRVLDAINEAPKTRHELKELTEISRFTLSRTLADFEERGWIVRVGQHYKPTGQGSLVASEFTTLLSNLTVAEELDDALDWLPTEQFGFDLACLRGSEVITPTEADHTAPIRRAAYLIDDADRFRGIATGVAYEVMDAIWESTVHDSLSLECILDASTFAAIRDDTALRRQFQEIVESERSEVFRCDGGETLVMMILCDDTVLMCGHAEGGPPPGTIETTDEEVRSWAESYLDALRADAHSLDAEAFRS